ncbi:ABC transporter permease [Propionispira raffinosivorans]|uniref:ABC transporter permease n=1 Tax=Propionispira raffinosivorans TaxID=86959 RepID=UPI0003778E09|nr:ABC transporter permease [Propionispira raffinosivorans]
MFWQMVKGAMLRQSRKMLMVALTVALGVSLTTAMLNVMLDVGDKVNQELKAYGANISVTPKNSSVLKDVYGLDSTVAHKEYLQESDVGKLKTIFWTNNIVAFAPSLEMKLNLVKDHDLMEEPITVIGSWFDYTLSLPTGDTMQTGLKYLKSWWTIDGEWVQDTDLNSIMLGKRLADRMGINSGDTITYTLPSGAGHAHLTVVGIFNGGGQEDNEAFVPLAFIRKMASLSDKIDKIEVSAITTPENDLARKAAANPKNLSMKEWETWYCTSYVSSIAFQIEEVVQNSIAKPVRQVAESEGKILQKTQMLMLLITALSLLSSALGISNLVSANIMERSKELGLLKALGASNQAVVFLILTEIFITGFIGGIGGYFLGLGFAKIIGQTVFGSAIAINFMVIPWVIILMVLVILIGSLPAIRMLLSLRPAAVLHGR